MKNIVEIIDDTLELKLQGADIAKLNARRGIPRDIDLVCSVNVVHGIVYIDKDLMQNDVILRIITRFLKKYQNGWKWHYPDIYNGVFGTTPQACNPTARKWFLEFNGYCD